MPAYIRLKSLKTSITSEAIAPDSADVLRNIKIGDLPAASYTFLVGEKEFTYTRGIVGDAFLQTEMRNQFNKTLEPTAGEYPLILEENPEENLQLVKSLLNNNWLKDVNSKNDIDEKIETIEKELSAQKEIDSFKKDKEAIQKEIDESETLLASVANLSQKLEASRVQLNFLNQKKIADTNQIKVLKSAVLDNIKNSLSGSKSRIKSIVKTVKESIQALPVWPPIVWGSFSFLFSIVLAIRLLSLDLVLVGIFFALLQFALIYLLVEQNKQLTLNTSNTNDETSNSEGVNVENLINPKAILNNYAPGMEEDLGLVFANSALKQAYEDELQRLEQTINEHLGGKEFTTLQQELESKKIQNEQLASKIEESKSRVLPPDQYLKKRRELDMLKMEKRRNIDPNKKFSYKAVFEYLLNATKLKGISLSELAKKEIIEMDNSIQQIELQEGVLRINGETKSIINFEIVQPVKLLFRLLSKVSQQLSQEYLLYPLMLRGKENLRSELASAFSMERQLIIIE